MVATFCAAVHVFVDCLVDSQSGTMSLTSKTSDACFVSIAVSETVVPRVEAEEGYGTPHGRCATEGNTCTLLCRIGFIRGSCKPAAGLLGHLRATYENYPARCWEE